MKRLVQRFIGAAVRNDKIWNFLDSTLVRVAQYARWQREKLEIGTESERSERFINSAIISISPDCTVMHGPFKGMKYPQKKAVGSALVPKLLGSYEKEIQPIIERICTNRYSEIVDIGCAEGYYAVGLARRLPKAKVYAFDVNQEALFLCQRMAQANNVAERIIAGAFCDSNTIRSLPFSGRALIISDCEGYEKTLFSDEIIPFLADHDLLIEIHDFMDIEISACLRRRFRGTHDIAAIQSVDDIAKAHTYCFPELDGYSLAQRRQLLAEERPSVMEWFFMTSRTAGSLPGSR